jgi:hypothetical protein
VSSLVTLLLTTAIAALTSPRVRPSHLVTSSLMKTLFLSHIPRQPSQLIHLTSSSTFLPHSIRRSFLFPSGHPCLCMLPQQHVCLPPRPVRSLHLTRPARPPPHLLASAYPQHHRLPHRLPIDLPHLLHLLSLTLTQCSPARKPGIALPVQRLNLSAPQTSITPVPKHTGVPP